MIVAKADVIASVLMSQGRVIDIIIIGGSYSLQYYSF